MLQIKEINKLSEAVRLLRIYSDIKQQELAKEFEISGAYLSGIENGKREIPLEIVKKYSDFFKIDVSTIIFFAEQLKKKRSLKRDIFLSVIQTIKEG